ncbi:hypothetical protein A4S06_05135 [Erysipelotrichaceae bacterium MTC7]|nr:hypothetical protein A4S06_05135 [Erysipelotrichaceae bacterium MTC7]
MKIRHARKKDALHIASIEAACFPISEAASQTTIEERIATFPGNFWILEDEHGEMVSFINGMMCNETKIHDAMFASTSCYQHDGNYFAIFSVCTKPSEQHKNYASILMSKVIGDCRSQNRQGIILTCKKQLLPFYERFGYINLGISSSTHGDAIWYDMQLDL